MKATMHAIDKMLSQKNTLLLLAVIVLLGTFLRFYDLGDNSFVADEFLDVNATYGYVQTGEHRSWDFNMGAVTKRQNALSDERAWLYREQVAFLYKFLPPTELVARSVSALWGIVGILIIYFVTFSLTRNRTIALVAAFLLAVSVPMIEIDRKIRMYAMFWPVFLLFSWSLFQLLETGRSAVQEKSKKLLSIALIKDLFPLNYLYLIPTIFLSIIAFHLHPLTANIAFVLFAYFFILSCQKKEKQFSVPRNMRYSVYALAMIVVALGVKVILPERWMWFMSTLTFFEDHWSYVGHLLRNYWHPLLGGLLMVVGGWHLVMQKNLYNKKAGLWIICNFIVIIFVAVFLWKRNVGPQYIAFIQSFGLILAASGIYALLSWVKQLSSSVRVPLVILFLALFLVPNYAYFFERNNTYHLKSDADTPNYREVFVFVKKDFNAGDALITRNFRSYYFSGFNAVVHDFGSERSEGALAKEGKVKKMTLARMREIMTQHERGWIVYSDNDEQFIEKELQKYLEENIDTRITKIDHINIRGKISVYQWGSDVL